MTADDFDPDRIRDDLEDASDVRLTRDLSGTAWTRGQQQARRQRWTIGALAAAAAVAAAWVIAPQLGSDVTSMQPGGTTAPTIGTPDTTGSTDTPNSTDTEDSPDDASDPAESESSASESNDQGMSPSQTDPVAAPVALSEGVAISVPTDYLAIPLTDMQDRTAAGRFASCLAPATDFGDTDCTQGVMLWTGTDTEGEIASPLDPEYGYTGQCLVGDNTQESATTGEPITREITLSSGMAATATTREITCDGGDNYASTEWRIPEVGVFAYQQVATEEAEDLLGGLSASTDGPTLDSAMVGLQPATQGYQAIEVEPDYDSGGYRELGSEYLIDVAPTTVCLAPTGTGPTGVDTVETVACEQLAPRESYDQVFVAVFDEDGTVVSLRQLAASGPG